MATIKTADEAKQPSPRKTTPPPGKPRHKPVVTIVDAPAPWTKEREEARDRAIANLLDAARSRRDQNHS